MSNAKMLQVALVGCGAVVQTYYMPALQELEKQGLLQVKALFDPSPERAAQLNNAFPAAVQVRDLGELSKLGIALAIVASPPRYHAEQTIQLLQAGLSVLCEKPMATSVAEGEAMVKATSTAPGLLAIGLFRRFYPATCVIKNLLSLNILGNIRSFYCYEGGKFDWPVQSASFFSKTTATGGVLLDVGVHLLDLLVWWWGQPSEVVYEDDAMGGVEANCRLKLSFAQGFSGEVRLSRDWSMPNRYVVQGEKGWLSWNVNEAEKIQLGVYQSEFALNAQLYQTEFEGHLPILKQSSVNFEQSFVSQLCNVMAAIYGSEPLVVSGEQGLHSLRIIEYCYRHRSLMVMPWLSEQETRRIPQLTVQPL